MKKPVVVLDADQISCRRICALLQDTGYSTVALHRLDELEKLVCRGNLLAVFMDIDTVPVDNRFIRQLVTRNPGTFILCASRDRFHPELKDAICYHIYACLNKPIDPDELLYWVKSIATNETDNASR